MKFVQIIKHPVLFVFLIGFSYFLLVERKPEVPSWQSKKTIQGYPRKNVIKENKISGTNKFKLVQPEFNESWSSKNIDSKRAWRITKGDRKIIVAVIDTGVDIYHPDLVNNIWTNPGEVGLDKNGNSKESNKVDDDQNGFIDDVHGWNFSMNNNDLSDGHGHWTHIAGIIGAEGRNNSGVRGVSPKVSLMVLKYYDPKIRGLDNLRSTTDCIKYATKMGANIINYSSGGLVKDEIEKMVIREAGRKKILFVAAAGNEHSDSDIFKYYPADYDLPNIISVTAIDPQRNILKTSNFGKHTVDIAAPGFNIYSTLPFGKYGHMTGTSQATAFVSGVASLLMAHRENYSNPQRLIEHLLNTGEKAGQLKGKTRRQVTLNTYRALAMFESGVGAYGNTVQNTSKLDPSLFTLNINSGDLRAPLSFEFEEDRLENLAKLFKSFNSKKKA